MDCLFCNIVNQTEPAVVLYRDAVCTVILDPRIASHNFVTGCLTSSVTGGLYLVGFEGVL